MKVITIKFKDPEEWRFLHQLLKRLKISFEWKEESVSTPKPTKGGEDFVARLFGSWPSDKASDELVKSIYEARVNQTRNISL